jgi:hypothetical protein
MGEGASGVCLTLGDCPGSLSRDMRVALYVKVDEFER